MTGAIFINSMGRQSKSAVDILGGTIAGLTGLNFAADAARSLVLPRNTTTVGSNLTLGAGGAKSGGTNLAGGDLYLSSGIPTGTGTSNVYIQTAGGGTTGTADAAPTTKLTILGSGNVGIGKSPTVALDVVGTELITGYFQLTGHSSWSNWTLEGLSDGSMSGNTVGYWNFKTYSSGTYNTKLRINNNGNVVVGAETSLAKFQVTQGTAGPGTVSVSGTAVTGVGTQFTNTFKVGDVITVTTTSGSEARAIATITSDTVLVTAAFAGAAAAGTAYTLVGGDRMLVYGNGMASLGGATAVGQLNLPTATTAAGGIYFSTDTAIWRSAAGVLAMNAAATIGPIQINVGASAYIPAWIDMPINGSTGIGSGGLGVNPWIFYCGHNGDFIAGAAVGDIGYRNTGGKLLFATSADATDLAVSGRNVAVGSATPTAKFQVTQGTSGPGTVSVSGTAVTGVGTQFTNTFKVGDVITVTTTSGSEARAIATITSDTVLVTAAFAGTAAAGTAYTLVGGDRFLVYGNGNVVVGSGAASQLFEVFGNGAIAGITIGSTASKLRIQNGGGTYGSFALLGTGNGDAPLTCGVLTAGATTIGGGNAITKVITATAALDFGSILTLAYGDLTIALTGAAVGDSVDLGIPVGAFAAGASFDWCVSATDVVTVRCNNVSAGSINPASGTFRATIIKF